MNPRIGFRGWGFMEIMRAYQKALLEGRAGVELTPTDDGICVMGIDVGHPDGDRTAFAQMRGTNIHVVILDDPHEEAHTYEGEFHVVPPREAMSHMAKLIKFDEALPAARSTEKNKGPQPRTKYPRRR